MYVHTYVRMMYVCTCIIRPASAIGLFGFAHAAFSSSATFTSKSRRHDLRLVLQSMLNCILSCGSTAAAIGMGKYAIRVLSGNRASKSA